MKIWKAIVIALLILIAGYVLAILVATFFSATPNEVETVVESVAGR